MYKLAIFDLDGTLLDTLRDLYNAVNHALKEFSFPERSLEEVRAFIGNGVVRLVERSTPDGTDEKTNAECLDVFRAHYLRHMADNTAPYQGTKELLSALREKGIKLAVVSNKLHPAVEKLCEDYFPGLIDSAIGVSIEEERKPSPINVLKAIDTYSVTKEETIYIGDSEVDVQTSHNASIKCIGVTWGFRDKNTLESAGCEFISDSCEEIFDIITK